MPIHQLTLLAREEIARDTLEFRFKKPSDFQFKPGQYGGFTLIHTKELDPKNTTRRFSIASAPHDEHITVTTRMQTSPYKQALNSLPLGENIKFAGPTGNFLLHEDQNQEAVFIAGGIGITPFYSMIKHAIHSHNPQTLTLFYGNQSLEDAAYFHELKALSENQANFNFIPVFVKKEDQHETGYISYELIKKYVKNVASPIFYVCGSPAMVSALHETLKELNIPDDHIKVEDFPGY